MKKIMFNDRYGLTEAVLSGRKTQTRRIVKRNQLFKRDPDGMWTDDEKKAWEQSGIYESDFRNEEDMRNAFEWLKAHASYKVGEVVAVAQSYKDAGVKDVPSPIESIFYEAHHLKGWNNKMFVRADLMPHQIRITNVRVERLNDISEADCIAEGVIKGMFGSVTCYIPNMSLGPYPTPREAYAALIDHIAGKGTWERNPWVFVYDF